MDTGIWRFLCGCPGSDGLKAAFFATEAIDQSDGGEANSLFCVYHGDQWYSYSKTPEWTAIAIAAARYLEDSRWIVVAMSQAGALWELRPRDRLESFGQIPGRIGMTNLATIENAVYACGMGRVLLRREAEGRWTDLSAPWPDPNEGVIGFTAIAGAPGPLIYSVGWQGEIWTRSGQIWQREDTPTNANLNAIALSPDGTAYAVGDDGSMLKGRRGLWESIETGTDLNLTDVCIHEDGVYVASDFQVYHLTPSGLEPDFGDEAEDAPQTCLKVFSAGSNGLYSMGPSDVFLRLDGEWRRLA